MNFAFVAGTLHHLLAGAVPYSETVAAYVLANITGLVSHVPGGIGVLEYVISSRVTNGNVGGAVLLVRAALALVSDPKYSLLEAYSNLAAVVCGALLYNE